MDFSPSQIWLDTTRSVNEFCVREGNMQSSLLWRYKLLFKKPHNLCQTRSRHGFTSATSQNLFSPK